MNGWTEQFVHSVTGTIPGFPKVRTELDLLSCPRRATELFTVTKIRITFYRSNKVFTASNTLRTVARHIELTPHARPHRWIGQDLARLDSPS